ncbi:MAG TPA: arginine deiminase-related protein [Steroidobacteraceae bacterium]|nr:arginine deiminase-related protein [Steroidobacteraceae bacterium]
MRLWQTPLTMQHATRGRSQQCAGAVFMIEPAAFSFNEETAASNAMQRSRDAGAGAADVMAAARAESQQLRLALESEGVRVQMGADTPVPRKPDALFPNNWISFHDDGTIVLYPMLAPNRRLERRTELVDEVCAALDFNPRRRLDFSAHETAGKFLEGTGSLVLDHVARVAYACRSPRTDAALVGDWAGQMDYEAVIFDAADAHGRPYYHTNVLMWIGSRGLMCCTEAIAAADRPRVVASFRNSGRELIEIDRAAVDAFAGNMLELATWDEALGDATLLVMSATARAALGEQTMRQLSGCVDTVLAVPVPTIERIGGGSVRCMLAEVPEPRA